MPTVNRYLIISFWTCTQIKADLDGEDVKYLTSPVLQNVILGTEQNTAHRSQTGSFWICF